MTNEQLAVERDQLTAGELRQQLALSQQHAVELTQELSTRARQLDAALAELAEKDGAVGGLEEQLPAQAQALAARETEVARLRDELALIYSLKVWKLMAVYWSVVAALRRPVARLYWWFSQRPKRESPHENGHEDVLDMQNTHQPAGRPSAVEAQLENLAPLAVESQPDQFAPPVVEAPLEFLAPPPVEAPLENPVPPAVEAPLEFPAAPAIESQLEKPASPPVEAQPENLAPPAAEAPLENLAPPPVEAQIEYPVPHSFDVICFPIIDWEFRFQRPQQLMTQFVQAGHRGFYLRTTLHGSGVSARVQPITEGVFGVQLPGDSRINLYQDELAPPVVDNCLKALDELRRAAGITDAVCLVQLPFWTPLALAAREQWGWKVVYDCLDELSGYATIRPEMAADEARLIGQSDLVLAASRSLYARVSQGARQALLVLNATDFDHFHQAPPSLPLDGLPGPVIGFYGAIAEWFDVDMIRYAAVLRPEWQFVLIGNTFGADLGSLGSLPNVHLLGEKPYSELPGYLHRFDVTCIPFKINALTSVTNPVKFYEYLSAGKPVVSVEIPEMAPFQDYFYRVQSAADFVPQCEAALCARSPELAAARVAFAQQHTWRRRSQAVLASLAALYGKAQISM